MTISSKVIIPALAVTVAGAGLLYSARPAQAQTAAGPQGFHQQLIQKLATKFNVPESEVQNVFTEVRTAHHQEMEQKMLARLDQAVSEGKLTEAQKQAVIAKHAEMRQQMETNREAMKNMTPEQRKAAMQQHHSELQAWAKEQGIDLQYVMPKFVMKVMKNS